MSRGDSTYTIGELAASTGVTPRTIRYYVTQGLLPPGIQSGHQRVYSEEHESRIREIKRLKGQYLPLKVIRDILDGTAELPDDGGLPETNGKTVCEGPPPLCVRSEERALYGTEQPTDATPEDWVRVKVGPGVEIHYQRSAAAGRESRIEGLVNWARRELR